MICASAVSRPIRVALNRKLPVWLIVPATTSEPTLFSTGKGSPVSIASSSVEWPSSKTPSTGIFSPGLTRKVSPKPTSSIGTSNSKPSLMTLAVRGCRPINCRMAPEVLPLAIVSRPVPRFIKARITTAASK